MKYNNSLLFALCSLLFVPLAHAAGTYYNGAYQNPQQQQQQQRYVPSGGYNQQGYASGGYATQQAAGGSYSNSAYSRYQPMQPGQVQQMQQPAQQQRAGTSAKTSSTTKTGFYVDGGLSRETAQWEFDMKQSGSILQYNNIAWNVFDLNAGYAFGVGTDTTMQIDAGLKFGFQGTESTMTDDDITNGGYFITEWVDGSSNVIGDQIGHALSVGTSKGGSMFGWNIGLGLTDFFKLGNTRITPSIGYRSFTYKLKTENNYGMSVDTSACFEDPDSHEVQCDPAIIVNYSNGSQQIIWRANPDDPMTIGSGADNIETAGTYYYQQPGVSHSYEVAWNGPYVALDLDYEINRYNSVSGRVEFGLPGYSAIGDQPYRFDWQHPKSVEDEAGIGSAMNLGLGANWNTALSDSVMLSIGLTYNYYTVSGANATTYLNGNYYVKVFNLAQDVIDDAGSTAREIADAQALQANIVDLENSCPGWVCKVDNEVNSFYKSMGIRIGINAMF